MLIPMVDMIYMFIATVSNLISYSYVSLLCTWGITCVLIFSSQVAEMFPLISHARSSATGYRSSSLRHHMIL